jgi:DNA-binding CsgD family transcriptional regulator
MFNLTDQQREVASLLLIGADHAQICDRLSIKPNTLRATITQMRVRLGAANGPAMMARLRELNRHPVDAALDHCRRHPATWCSGLMRADPDA